MRALRIEVFRNPLYKGCANGGISEKYNDLLLVCEKGNVQIDEDNLPENLVVMKCRVFSGREIFHIEPYKRPDKGCVGWMSGGSYAGSSDSRFSEMAGGFYGTISIHDRQESQEQYDNMFN